MKLFKRIYFAALMPAVGCIAAAQSPASVGEGYFYDIADRLVGGNYALKAEAASTMAEVEELRAGAVPENPEVEFEHLWSGGNPENKWSVGITQSLPWPGVLGARGRAADLLSLAREQGLARSERELRLRVLQTLADVTAANRKVQILTEIHDSMSELRARYEQAWKQGETTLLDLNKIKIEEIRSASELESAVAQHNTLINELRSIAPDSAIAASVSALTDFPVVELASVHDYLGMIDQSPEMAYLQAMQAVEQQNIAVEKALRLPGVSLGYRHAFEEGTHFNGFAVGLTLPVYSRRNDVAAATSRYISTQYTLAARRLEIEHAIRAEHSAAMSLRSQIALYAPVVENVNNQALLRRALDGGQISLLDYLQETTYFLRARLEYVDLTASYLRLAFSLSRYR